MQVLTIFELVYASYSDIRYMETEPLFILGFILARVGEMVQKKENILAYLAIAGIVFFLFLFGSACFSLGGADALIAVLICMNLGFYGIYAIILGLVLAVPFVLMRKGQETPLIPFLGIGYCICLIVIKTVF